MYHYTESGLDNVWLENGYNEKQTAYGKSVSVDDADGLHQVLAIQITNKKGRITGKELRFLRAMLGLSQDGIAKMIGVTEQSLSLWERTGKVPKSADTVVRLLVLERLDGDGKISEVINRINDVERLVNQRIVAKETRHRWTSKLKAAEDERFALAA
jgi:DNA-binding transcriptional regulator YiaG